jgi:ribonuclease BN (tRNA processing enzyme)
MGAELEHGRRTFLKRAAIASGLAAAGVAAGGRAVSAQAASIPTGPPLVPSTGAYIVLLGTSAGPVPFLGRTGISSALVVDGQIYLIDLGHGSFDQFQTLGLSPSDIAGVFITHLHSDHIANLFTMLWLRFGGIDPLTSPLQIYGPGSAGALPPKPAHTKTMTVDASSSVPGLATYISKSIEASAYDINVRMRDEGWPDIETRYDVHEIALPAVGASALGDVAPAMAPFPIMSDDKVSVTAILVEHPPVFPSFAFRFDTAYGSVAFSGDTTVTPNMVTLAQGADSMVHEAIDIQAVEAAAAGGGLSAAQIAHLEGSHTDVTKLGAIAQQAGVGQLVLTHLAPGTIEYPDAIWLEKAQQGYLGPVVVGHDLMVIPLT